jgi:hypothetical protein
MEQAGALTGGLLPESNKKSNPEEILDIKQK